MIYCLNPEMYPKEESIIESLSYRDENDFKWTLARVDTGFFIRYLGDSYFRENYFRGELPNGEHVTIKNTNCIYVKDSSFDTFYQFREIIKKGWTDDIWEWIEDCFQLRFNEDSNLLESEVYSK